MKTTSSKIAYCICEILSLFWITILTEIAKNWIYFQTYYLLALIQCHPNMLCQIYYQSKYWPRHSFLADPHHLTISNSGQCLPPCFGCLRTFLLRRCSPIPHDLLQVSHGPQSPTLQFFGPSEILKYVLYTSSFIVINVLYVKLSILIDMLDFRTYSIAFDDVVFYTVVLFAIVFFGVVSPMM